MNGTNVEPTTNVIDDLIQLEQRIEAAAETVFSSAAHARGKSLAADLRATSRRHREDLERQRDRIAAGALTAELPSSRSAGKLYAALSEAAFAYAEMHARAHRDFDSQNEGNTAALAELHLQAYSGAIQELNLLGSDIAVDELGTRDVYCRCQCPACAFGLCLCSPHGSTTVREVMQKEVSEPHEAGVRVRRPRPGSEAERPLSLSLGHHRPLRPEVDWPTNMAVCPPTTVELGRAEPIVQSRSSPGIHDFDAWGCLRLSLSWSVAG